MCLPGLTVSALEAFKQSAHAILLCSLQDGMKAVTEASAPAQPVRPVSPTRTSIPGTLRMSPPPTLTLELWHMFPPYSSPHTHK